MRRLEDVVLFQLDLTNRVSKQFSQKEFDRLGLKITVEQWVVLMIISESPELSQRELAERSYRDPASITRTLDLLHKKGLINRESIPGNRRKHNIVLTEAGRNFINANMETVQKQRQQSIRDLSAEEIRQLGKILEKIRNNMK